MQFKNAVSNYRQSALTSAKAEAGRSCIQLTEEKIVTNEALDLIDLGDATTETKQHRPYPPIYPDFVFGMGSVPPTSL